MVKGETTVAKTYLPGISNNEVLVSIEYYAITIRGRIENEQEIKGRNYLMQEGR